MRFLTSILIALLFFCYSCKRSQNPSPASNKIIGAWELRGYSPGLNPYLALKSGNGNQVIFNPNGTYSFVSTTFQFPIKNALGSYFIKISPSNTVNLSGSIYYNDSLNDLSPLSLSNDSLTLGTSVLDGPTYFFVKLK